MKSIKEEITADGLDANGNIHPIPDTVSFIYLVFDIIDGCIMMPYTVSFIKLVYYMILFY